MDCRTYNGPQPREQETDQHDSCVGDGEFNWRFVFSRIQVRMIKRSVTVCSGHQRRANRLLPSSQHLGVLRTLTASDAL